MNNFRFFLVATMLVAAIAAPSAYAQTPVNISIVSGNGQITCPLCTQGGEGLQNFDPLYVRVTDPNGNPVANTTVNWIVSSGQGVFSINTSSAAPTTTDVNGIASVQYFLQNSFSGSSTNPYVASTITASIANNASVNFFLTQALVPTSSINVNAPTFIQVENLTPGSTPSCATCINPGDSVTGSAGSTSAVQFEVAVSVVAGAPIPNVSLRLVPNQTSPTISCATEAGADPGSVLTNANGIATCTAILGSTTGSGSFYFIVGGVNASLQTGGPLGFFQSGNFSLNVTPGVAGMISITSGNNQGGNPAQALTSPLVATVADASGNPLAGQSIVWSVSPAGAATLSTQSGTSASNGQVQTNVTLSSTASGSVQIRVALANNPNVGATFTVTANVKVSGLSIVSGNSQSALPNAAFGLPLVVQLSTTNGTSIGNLPVSFSISGPATLTASAVTTNSAGQAQVNVTAGSTPGAVTVLATAGGFSQTFSLTVIPQGPTLTSGSFYNGADFQQGSISPCGIATIMAAGLAPSIQGAVAYDGVGGLPYTLAGDTVIFNGAQAPIFNVANLNGRQQLTFQVPCSVTPGSSVPVTVNVSGASVTLNIPVLPASPGLFTTQLSATTTVPVLERPDGSFVSATNPARSGETVIAYVTGLGPTSPAVATNSLPVPNSTAKVQGTVIVGINGQGVNYISATLTPDLVGVYEVAFQVPSSVPSGSTAGFSIGILPQGSTGPVYYSTLGMFPVQ